MRNYESGSLIRASHPKTGGLTEFDARFDLPGERSTPIMTEPSPLRQGSGAPEEPGLPKGKPGAGARARQGFKRRTSPSATPL